VAVTFVSLLLRTPLRWVLGGPVRAEQRVRDEAELAARRGAVTQKVHPSAENVENVQDFRGPASPKP
jgi:hypothetical protein